MTGKSPRSQPTRHAGGIGIDPIFVRIALVIAVGMLIGAFVSTWQETRDGGPVARVPVGTDFATFHGAASMVVDGDGDSIYTPLALGSKIAVTTSYEESGTQLYGHPPFFPLFFLPFARIAFVPAYILFVALGVGALGLAIARVGGVRPIHAVGIALLSIPGYATAQLGQMGFWVSALLVATYLAMRRGHLFSAGLLIGLLAFKPLYAVGIGLWWLLSGKRYVRAIGGAFSSIMGLVLLGFLVPGGWSAYISSLEDTSESFLKGVSNSGFSIQEMLTMLFGDSPVATGLWLAAVVVSLVALRRLIVGLNHRLEPTFALAVVVGLLLSPRVGWYDWVLLVVPAVLLWRALPERHDRLVIAGVWLLPIAAVSWPLARWFDGITGIYVQIAPIALTIVAWWWFTDLLGVPSQHDQPAETTAAV